MQVLVLYYSASGNTKLLAEEIAKGVEEADGVKAVLKSTKDVTKNDFLESQGIIAGSPVYFGTMAAQLKEVFDRYVGTRPRMGDKIGAAFCTGNDPTGGKETTMLSILQAFYIYGMITVGDPLDATGHYGVACQGRPQGNTLENARLHGRRVAELVLKVHG